MKQKAIIVDLDGTLALFKNEDGTMVRSPFIDKLEDCHHYLNDKVNEPVAELLSLVRTANTQAYMAINILFTSGRYEITRTATSEWLLANCGYPGDSLFMRADGDYRADEIVKEEIYRTQIEPLYDVLFVLDDRNKVVDMWRSIGLTCFQVAPGDF